MKDWDKNSVTLQNLLDTFCQTIFIISKSFKKEKKKKISANISRLKRHILILQLSSSKSTMRPIWGLICLHPTYFCSQDAFSYVSSVGSPSFSTFSKKQVRRMFYGERFYITAVLWNCLRHDRFPKYCNLKNVQRRSLSILQITHILLSYVTHIFY